MFDAVKRDPGVDRQAAGNIFTVVVAVNRNEGEVGNALKMRHAFVYVRKAHLAAFVKIGPRALWER